MKKFWIITGLIIFLALNAWGDTYYWTDTTYPGSDGIDWENPFNWENVTSYPGVAAGAAPGSGDDVVISGAYSVTLNTSVTVKDITVTGGATLDLNDTLAISGSLNLSGGDLTGSGPVTFGSGTISLPATTAITITGIGGSIGVLNTDTRDISITTAGTSAVSIGNITSSGNVTITTAGAGGTVNIGSISNPGGTRNLILGGTKTFNGGAGNTFDDVTVSGAITLDGNDLSVTNSGNTGALVIGGSLNGGGQNIIANNITINGPLTQGSGSITVTDGAWNRTAAFTPGAAPVTFYNAAVNSGNTFGAVICTGTVVFSGSNIFSSLACNSATVSFAAGITQIIPGLTATGTTSLTRSGTTDYWYVTGLTAGAFSTTAATTISWCKSASEFLNRRTSGTPVSTLAQDGGDNIRVFAGGTFYWIGGNGSLWAWDNNWSDSYNGSAYYYPPITDDTTTIIIPDTLNDDPALGAAVVCGALIIDPGAQLDLVNNTFALAVSGTLTNGGILNLRGAALSATTLANSGVIQLQGSQAITINGTAPPGTTPGGTIRYQTGAGSAVAWPFGLAYSSLTVDPNVTMGTAASLTVNNTATIGSNITAANNQEYNGDLILGGTGTRTLTSSSGSVSAIGVVSGAAGVTVSASAGISMSNTGNTLEGPAAGPVTLNNSGAGAVSFRTASTNPLTINGNNPGNFSVNAGGNIAVGSGGINAAGTITLDSAGTVSQSGAVTGGGTLSVNAVSGINLGITSPANNNASVYLSNTGPTGIISYSSSRGAANSLTITALNSAASGGTISITESTGNLIVGSGTPAVDTATDLAAVNLTASQGTITANGNIGAAGSTGSVTLSAGSISVNGSITAYRLALLADTLTGSIDIALGSAVAASSAGNESNAGANAAAVYVSANSFTGWGNITLSGGGAVCVNINSVSEYTGAVTYPGGIHYHAPNNKHLVYRSGADEVLGYTGLTPGSYVYINAALNLGTNANFSTAGTGCIYIIDQNNAALANARTVTFTAGAFIEIRGAYTSTGTLTLSPGNNTVRLANSEATPANPAELNLPSFSVTGTTLLLLGGTGTAASITTTGAGGIVLGSVTGQGAGINKLSLNSGASYPINVTGSMGAVSPGNYLGNVEIVNTSLATFSGAVYAAGYTQYAGSAAFSAAQNYTGPFSFTGTNLTLGSGATLATAAGAANSVSVNNTGAFTQNYGANISSGGAFSQTVNAGTSNLSASIVTSGGNISFAGPVYISGAATGLSTGSTGTGNIGFTNAINGTGMGTDDISMTAGTGNISMPVVGNTMRLGNITIVSAADVTFPGSVNAGRIQINNSGAYTQYGNVTASGTFSQTGSGTVLLQSNIAVTNTVKANAGISFARLVTLAANVTFTAPSTGGSIVLSLGESGGSGPYVLTLAGGSAASPLDIGPGGAGLTADVDDITVAANSYVAASPGTIRQTVNKTLTLTGGSAVTPTTLGAVNGSWFMGNGSVPSYTPAFGSGFAGFTGNIVLNANTVLSVRDFYNTEEPVVPPSDLHSVTISGMNVKLSASGNVWLNRTFVPDGGCTLLDSTLEMTGTGNLTVRTDTSTDHLPLADIGHFVAGDAVTGHTTTIASNVYFRGDVTITDGNFLNGGSAKIFVFPLNQGFAGNTWNQGNSGVFIFGTSEVEFGNSSLLSGHTYTIKGDTSWYNLVCHENAATLKFSNYAYGFPGPPAPNTISGTKGHRVNNLLIIRPSSMTEANMIRLTRLDIYPHNNVTPPHFPSDPIQIPPSEPNHYFWYFFLASNARFDMNYVDISYSFSQTRIPVPSDITDPTWRIDAWPYVYVNSGTLLPELLNPINHWNVNWFVFNNFFYGFTEDSNHNGRIDRIRLQSAFGVISEDKGGFDSFVVTVRNNRTGDYYRVKGYRRVIPASAVIASSSDLDSIYVELEEMPYADSGDTLHWRLLQNKSLWDYATYVDSIGSGSVLVGVDDPPDEGDTTDTAPPRITYTLALPGHNELFVQFSEKPAPGFTVSVAGVGVPLSPIAKTDLAPNEFVFDISPYSAADLANTFPEIEVAGLNDGAPRALDLHTEHPSRPYYFMFPSPKYPRNYLYDGAGFAVQPVYLESHDPDAFDPAPAWLVDNSRVFPPNKSYDLSAGGVSDPVTHHLTDMLVSVPPGAGRLDRYFVWPVWARYNEPANPFAAGNNTGDFYGQSSSDSGIIWEFTGTKYLEQRDTVMQVSRQPGISGDPELVFAYNVPSLFRRGANARGLWIPKDMTATIPVNPWPPQSERDPAFTNLSPYFYPVFDSKTYSGTTGANLFLYEFTAGQDGYRSGNTMDFFFHLSGTIPGLFAGRLDIAPSAEIPAGWYRLVKPFSFAIHDVTLQRSGVTILNNVINPSKGESTYIDYRLVKSGQVTIQVFTLDGTMVSVLYRGNRPAGEYRAAWNGTNRGGRAVARGMYFIRIVAPDIDEIRKVMVVR